MLTRAPMTAQPPSEMSSPAPAPARPAGITPVLLLILDGFEPLLLGDSEELSLVLRDGVCVTDGEREPTPDRVSDSVAGCV